MPSKRVVITGVGCRTPIGSSYEQVKKSLYNNLSAIVYDREHNACCAKVNDQVDEYFTANDLDITDRFTRLASLSFDDAVADSGTKPTGIFLGTGFAGALSYESAYADLASKGRVRPSALVQQMQNNATNYLALKHNITEQAFTYTVACASSSLAIVEGYKAIASKQSKVVAVGGSEASLTKINFASWKAMRASVVDSNNPRDSVKPFSKDRKGIALAEGAAIFILEELESALSRKAKIYGEIIGYGISCGAETVTKPDTRGQVAAFRSLGRMINLNNVTYINAHGTGTPIGDLVELESINNCFGREVPVSSTKNMHGHLLGAAGAMETLACLSVMETGKVIPNWNLSSQESSENVVNLPVDIVDFNSGIVLNNSFAFGGTNVILAFQRI